MNFKAAVLVLIATGGLALAQSPSAFEVASIRPAQPGNQKASCATLPGGRFVCHNFRVRFLLGLAFSPRPAAIKGGPGWLDDDLYDIDAQVDGAGEMTFDELAAPMLALFRDRFGLVAHEEAIQQTVYSLEQQKSGSKLKPSPSGTEFSDERSTEGVQFRGEAMAHFAGILARRPDVASAVIDNTGLVGKFDFTFPYVDVGGNGSAPAGDSVTPDVAKRFAAAYFSTFDALATVGLRLRPEKRDATAVVIDQIHRPSAN